MRAGIGYDVHRFGGPGPLLLAGVVVDESRGVEATSDGDVVAHAVIDALLGALALGDIGERFPEGSSAGLDSMAALETVVAEVREAGGIPAGVDVTVVAQSVRISLYRDAMRAALAGALGIDGSLVSVKATTTDGLGAIGRDEGIAVMACAVVDQR